MPPRQARASFASQIVSGGLGLLLLLSVAAGRAADGEAGLPALRNFTNHDYGGHNRNWCFAEDAAGRLYIGNRDAVLVFDGTAWQTLPLPGAGDVRGLAFDGAGRLHVAALRQFGWFESPAGPAPHFVSLLEKLPAGAARTQVALGVKVNPDTGDVFYFSDARVRRWRNDTAQLEQIEGDDHRFFIAGGQLYRQRREGPLQRFTGKEWPDVSPALPDLIREVLVDDGALLAFSTAGVLRIAGGTATPWPTGMDDLWASNNLAAVLRMADGSLAVSLSGRGVILLGADGCLLGQLDESGGLQNQVVYALHADRHGGLWLALNFGLARVHWPTAWTTFNRFNGLPAGNVQALARHAGILYAATDQGLLRLAAGTTPGTTARWDRVAGFNSQAMKRLRPPSLAPGAGGFDASEIAGRDWSALVSHPSGLFVGGANGIYLYRGENEATRSVTPLPASALLVLPGEPLRLAFGGQKGVCLLQWNGTNWLPKGWVPGIPGEGIALAPADDGLWAATTTGAIARVRFPADANAKPSATLHAAGEAGLPDFAGPLTLNHRQGSLLVAGRELPQAAVDQVGTPLCFLEETGPDGTSVLWLGGTAGLVRAELPRAFATPRTLAVQLQSPNITRHAVRSYDSGPARFEFVAPHLGGGEVEYQTRLSGQDRDWLPWSRERVRSYSALPPGNYEFQVRARAADGATGPSVALAFSVRPPWWRAWWAFASYAAGGIASVIVLVRWRSRALRQRNIELERTVQARTVTLVQREQQLSEARDAAEAANRAKSAFLASMSHELRTPLNAILGYTQLLRGARGLPAESRRQLEVIHQSGDHLAGMINEVLDLAKVEAGRIELQAQPFSLNRLLALLTEMFALRAAQKDLAFSLHTAPGVPDFVAGDEARLRQVLLNLLGNALKFTTQGRVELHVAGTGGRVSFAVSDTGIGIPPAEQARIFERFYQAGGPALAAQGAGLGLAISQRLVRLMGGVIAVESTPDQGSTFRFELALPAAAAGPAPRSERLPAGYRGPRLHVLIVDDEPVNRDLLRTLLQPLGFLIEETDDGPAAIERVAAQPPALVLMDIRLKSLDGLEATRRIRALPVGGPIRIIAVTASVFPDDRTQAIAAGCDEFVEKPIQTARLVELIGRLLQVDWIRPVEPAGSPAPLLPGQLPVDWALLSPAVLDDLDALVEIGDLVAFRVRLAIARHEETAAHHLLDALYSLAAQARLADLRRWLEAARQRLSAP